ncbi:hypothetical protein BDP55DRAFT_629263 [Colletotrichum godetiae]|uniref:Uncharacterized protein n=1 Tax=Colletotrichum godetiae TaxID=1209918 RepID=A0AAJ0AQV8_9PEZI|nr:uncharacterized protein BDP55DRAFT_629263 [Colletotrichum godetiae]KAK1688698.1 hypothetical protein BDP55DRAFT_629263 [Colletotrichum godetiae]
MGLETRDEKGVSSLHFVCRTWNVSNHPKEASVIGGCGMWEEKRVLVSAGAAQAANARDAVPSECISSASATFSSSMGHGIVRYKVSKCPDRENRTRFAIDQLTPSQVEFHSSGVRSVIVGQCEGIAQVSVMNTSLSESQPIMGMSWPSNRARRRRESRARVNWLDCCKRATPI